MFGVFFIKKMKGEKNNFEKNNFNFDKLHNAYWYFCGNSFCKQ